jgi:hypothetical protein
MEEKQVNELVSRLVDGAGEKTRNLIVDYGVAVGAGKACANG